MHLGGTLMNNELQDNPGIIAPPPLIYAGTLAVGLLLSRAFPVKFLPRPIALMLGIPCIILGGTLTRSAFQEMRRANTNVDPRQPATALVTEGPFRYTRN